MYLSACWNHAAKVEARVEKASVYEDRGDGYRDHDSPDECWLLLACCADMIAIRMTRKQLESLIGQFPKTRQCVECGDPLGDVTEQVTVCAACESKPVCACCQEDAGTTAALRWDSHGNTVLVCQECLPGYDRVT